MKTFTILFLLFLVSNVYSQIQSITGKYYQKYFENGVMKTRIITVPQINPGINFTNKEETLQVRNVSPDPRIRWSFMEPYSVGTNVAISGNGLLNVCGWSLNDTRISVYDTASNIPNWEYFTNSSVFNLYVSVSDTAGVIAVGTNYNLYLFHKNSGTPFFNYDFTNSPDSGLAGPVALTFNGNFFVACVIRSDSSTVFGFNTASTVPVWKFKIANSIEGMKMAGYDSLLIVNTMYEYAVINTYTGYKRCSGVISGGSQMTQAISGDGTYIATIDYYGYVNVYQWNGTDYSLLWSFREPPGIYNNWISAVDISTDGLYLAAGALIFNSYSEHLGKIRFFRISEGNNPVWTLNSIGDYVEQIRFSRNSKIFAVCSWGDVNNIVDDLQIFKTTSYTNVPLYTVHTKGSLFSCSVSDDGRSVLAGGKLIYAGIWGYGGTLYNMYIDTSLNPVNIRNVTKFLPLAYSLKQNYPNPFNPETKINFQIPVSGFVNLKVFDVTGKEIATLVNQNLSAGTYKVNFPAVKYNLSSGIYFYKITVNGYSEIKKMMLIK